MKDKLETRSIWQTIGPALIVAAVVLGPGSILTSSKVGATLGLMGVPIILCATVLMIGMVALAARLGAVYEGTIGDELSNRLGRPFAIFIGIVIFVLIALFQQSNNVALVGGLQPVVGDSLSYWVKVGLLVGFNGLIILSLYLLPNLYQSVETLMKVLIGLMTVAFIANFAVVLINRLQDAGTTNAAETVSTFEWLPLLGMIGTTFSVAAAFYQAYLVREKGWGISRLKAGFVDSAVSISILGLITAIILMTSWLVFYGREEASNLATVGDVATQLEPLFGTHSKIIFCVGIMAGALSSFLVNALIGGTIFSDMLGLGSKMSDAWPKHFTVAALVVGMSVAVSTLSSSDSTVHLITLAQALTVLGIPALAATLIYLGTREELTGQRQTPKATLVITIIGFLIACVLAYMTAVKVAGKLM